MQFNENITQAVDVIYKGNWSQLAQIADINPSSIHAIKNGALPRADSLYKIVMALGVDANWLLTGEGHMYAHKAADAFVLVPRYLVRASAGAGADNPNEAQGEPMSFRRDWLLKKGINPEQAFLVLNTGDSMQPDIDDGVWLLVDGGQTEPTDGNIYIIRMGDELFTKSLQRRPEGWLAISSNKRYDAFLLDDQAQLIGRVRNSQKEW